VLYTVIMLIAGIM